jgi:MFS family permease
LGYACEKAQFIRAALLTCITGYSLAFGIFQEYYTTEDTDLSASPTAVASIGTSQTGIMYLMMPVTLAILRNYPQTRRWCAPLGLLITIAILVVSAYTSSVAGLIATQGVLYAVGCGLLFCPTSLYLDEWFIERKGFAYGIMWAGKSLVGVVMPFLMRALLDRYGLRPTILAWAIASAVMTMPLLFLLRPRVPASQSRAAPASMATSFSFLKSTTFWMLQAGNIVQSFGYLIPTTYLASYSDSLGFERITGPILLAAYSVASIPGGIVHGWLGDRSKATTSVLISSAGSAAAVFLLWGLSHHDVAVLVLFSLVYGFFAGGFSSTWGGILQEMRRRDSNVDTSLVFGMLMGGRGLGFLVSGPISGLLLDAGSHAAVPTGSPSSYSSEYGPMIICTGLTAVLGAWGWMWAARKHVRRLTFRLR